MAAEVRASTMFPILGLLTGGLLKLSVLFAVMHAVLASHVDVSALKEIRMPHKFTQGERDAMNAQIDKLKLGIDLFLSQENSLSEDQTQRAYNNVWPLVRLLFAADFDSN